jgi:putative FmdB family regulatory protein
MPTYEYKCQNCDHYFETFQSITANPLKKCPSCGKAKLNRLIGTGAGIIFKGSGFYETDYRSESYKNAEKSQSTSKPQDNKTEAKTETKIETKKEPKAEKPAKTKSA